MDVTFDTCLAYNCGEDGFTSHYANVFIKSYNCRSFSNSSGFAPAYGSTWTSYNDHLYSNSNSWSGKSKKYNLDLIGGAFFTAYNLRMDGVGMQYQMYTTGAKVAGSFARFYGGSIVAGASDPVTFQYWVYQTVETGATETMALEFYGVTFGGEHAQHAIDDNGSTVPITSKYVNCLLQNSVAGKYIFAFRGGNAHTALIQNCLIKATAGNGLFVTQTGVTLVNSIIAVSGSDVAINYGTAAYYNSNTSCGWNRFVGTMTGAVAKSTDKQTAPAIDANYIPLRGGNCDVGQGTLLAGLGLGTLDLLGRPWLRADAAPIGCMYPQRADPRNVLLPVVQLPSECV